jgi:dolichol-phosphate mannosyltransferase
MKISIVIPVYNCADSLIELSHRLEKAMKSVSESYEIIYVDDRSPDDAWPLIKKLCLENTKIKGLRLSKNFGQHPAIIAGLTEASGDWIIVMDGDLQDLPEEISKLSRYMGADYDVIAARRKVRQDNKFRTGASWFYSKAFAALTGIKMNHEVANFGIYSKKVIDALLSLKEKTRLFAHDVYWLGFSRIEVEVTHGLRTTGKSSYSFRGLLKIALDALISHSTALIQSVVWIGLVMSFSAAIVGTTLTIRYFIGGPVALGWTSLIVLMLFFFGLITFFIGVIGLYIGRTFNEVRNRPLFIIDATVEKCTAAVFDENSINK